MGVNQSKPSGDHDLNVKQHLEKGLEYLIDPLGASATKYEDEAGNTLAETDDGNEATVTVTEDNKDEFMTEINAAKETGVQNSEMHNESWIRRFGSEMAYDDQSQVQDWAVGAMGFDANTILPAIAGGSESILDAKIGGTLKARTRLNTSAPPYKAPSTTAPPSSIVFDTRAGRLEMNKSFASKASTTLKWGGRGLGVYNAYLISEDYQAGRLGSGQMILEQGSNTFSTLGGIYGAAWGIGWELGRAITETETYQDFKTWFWKE